MHPTLFTLCLLATPKVDISYFPICDLYIRPHVYSEPRTLSIINVACTLLDVVHVIISYIWLPFTIGNFRGCGLALGCAFYTFCTLVMRKLLRWVFHASLILKLKISCCHWKMFLLWSLHLWPTYSHEDCLTQTSLYCQCQIHTGGSGVM